MATKIASIDDVLKARTLAALKRNDKTIRKRVAAAAKKQGYNVSVSDVKKIAFVKFLGLEQTVKPSFGEFKTKEVPQPTFVDTADINNNSPAQIKRVVHYGEKETREFHWSVTAGVTVGASVSEKVGIPGLSSDVTLSMQMSVSATTGQAWRNDKDWSNTTEVTVPKFSTVHIQALLTRVVGDLPFTLVVQKNGKVRCQATLSYYGKRTRTFEIPLAQLLKPAERTFKATGRIAGACGVSCDIQARGRNLTAAQRQTLAKGHNTVPHSLGRLRL